MSSIEEMRVILSTILLLSILNVGAQTDIVANPGEYVEAQNYGGKVELKRFFQQEVNYPEKALTDQEEGTVELSFIVDSKTGKPSRLRVKQSVSKELDAEAIRLYKMLLFKPSYYKGDRVTTYSTLKFKFSLKNYKRICKKRGYEKIEVDHKTMDTSNIVYKDNEVKVKPSIFFEDSLENISSFIYKNLKYPQGTLKLNITGVVKLFFVVEPSGRITNIKVLKDVGGGATNEAIRLLKLTNWKAGEKDGKKVRVSKTFEVNFNLTSDSSIDYVPTQH